MPPEEIGRLCSQGRNELKRTQSPNTSKDLFLRSQEGFLRENYAKKKNVPQELMDELAVDPKLLKAKTAPIVETQIKENVINPRRQLHKFLEDHPDIEEKCKNYKI